MTALRFFYSWSIWLSNSTDSESDEETVRR